MQIRLGYDIVFHCPQATPMIVMLHVHYSHVSNLVIPDLMRTDPWVPMNMYRDGFGNWCTRLLAPPGRLRISADALINDSGLPEAAAPLAQQAPVESLPEETLVYLLPSRFCESDLLVDVAWSLFGGTAPGWSRVQAICDFVHNHIAFGYEHASPTKSACQVYNDRRGVCRDYAHLAIAFCRSLNIPARYCTCYLGDIGVTPLDAPMDFAASMEVYLDGAWHAFDPRNNQRRIGRILIARGRDAADVAITTCFGRHFLESFLVWTDEVLP